VSKRTRRRALRRGKSPGEIPDRMTAGVGVWGREGPKQGRNYLPGWVREVQFGSFGNRDSDDRVPRPTAVHRGSSRNPRPTQTAQRSPTARKKQYVRGLCAARRRSRSNRVLQAERILVALAVGAARRHGQGRTLGTRRHAREPRGRRLGRSLLAYRRLCCIIEVELGAELRRVRLVPRASGRKQRS
jgi:hypothetical protein